MLDALSRAVHPSVLQDLTGVVADKKPSNINVGQTMLQKKRQHCG